MLTIVVLALLHISIILGIDRRNLVSPLNAVLALIWIMVIRATELTVFGESIYPDWVRPYMSDSLILEASLVLSIFLACFLPSYFLLSFACSNEKKGFEEARIDVAPPKLLIFGMATAGMVCAAQFFSQLEEVTDIILQKTSEGVFEGNGLMIAGISLLPAAILGALLSCHTKRGFAVGSVLLLLIASAVYMPLGQRGNIFTFVIIALIISTAKFGHFDLKWTIAAGIALLLCLELAVIWRTTLRYGYEGELSDLLVVANALDGVDRGEFDGLAGIVAHRVSINLDSWWEFTEQLIPRAMLPFKREYMAVSYLVNQEVTGSASAGFTASIVGTLFAQAGWVGVALSGVILGGLMQFTQRWFTTNPCSSIGVLTRGVALVFVFFLARNGDLTNVLIMLIVNLSGVFVLISGLAFLPLWRSTWRSHLAHADSC